MQKESSKSLSGGTRGRKRESNEEEVDLRPRCAAGTSWHCVSEKSRGRSESDANEKNPGKKLEKGGNACWSRGESLFTPQEKKKGKRRRETQGVLSRKAAEKVAHGRRRMKESQGMGPTIGGY